MSARPTSRQSIKNCASQYHQLLRPLLPVKHLRLEVIGMPRGRVFGGTAYGGELIRIHLGREIRPTDFKRDWELTHEMFRLGFPEVDEDYHYMEEGLSDYLKPLARAAPALSPRATSGPASSTACPMASPSPVTRASTTLTPGVASTGEARSSGWRPT